MTRRTWWIAGGVAGAAAVGVGIALATRKAPATLTSHATAPGPGALALVSAGGLRGAPGSPVTAKLTFQAGSGGTAAQSVDVTVVLSSTTTTETMGATVQVPALAGGASATVALATAAAVSPALSGTVKVEISAMSATITGTLAIAANPASFVFGESSLGTIDASVGSVATFSVPVTNNGGTAAVPVVTGTNSYQGTVEGHWVQLNKPSVGPGQTATINMTTAGAVASMFAGDDLQISLSVTP